MLDPVGDEIPWQQLERDRLRFAMKRARQAQGLEQQEIAERAGMSRATLQRIISGVTNPGRARLQSIVDVVGVPITSIVKPQRDENVVPVIQVPVADIRVAAGPGAFALDEATVGTWPFPRDWLERQGPIGQLRVVHVSGDSQEPVLRDGDAVLVDLTPTTGSDGMHIVRLDDALMIKRMQIEGVRVRLKSHNPQYDDIVVHLREDGDRFAIVGRAVAAVKAL